MKDDGLMEYFPDAREQDDKNEKTIKHGRIK
jgi:hypothetical protein